MNVSIRNMMSPLWVSVTLLAWCFSLVQFTYAATGMLSETELAQLQEKSETSKRGTRLEFSASVQIPNLTPDEQEQYRQSGKVPFQVMCVLNEVKESGGRTLSLRQNGKVEIRILDKDSNVVASSSKALEKMCSS